MAAVTVRAGLVSDAWVGLVNAGPCPIRARAAEKVLVGGVFCDAAMTEAADAAAQLDAEVGGRRREAVRVLTRRALTRAREAM